ncbi:acyltransferase family protein [Bacillus salacetis]|uniref:acyltransferase family protein n=1 Tax=Bacillus salacetis TaxID=2315464 RepID=UPI003B9F3F4C
MKKQGSLRRYDLDWIKVLATMFVFLYHCSMFFNPFEWHVKNNEVDSTAILTFSLLIGTWIMPIFFVISGVSSNYSLQKRSAGTYLKERFIRLGIPLLFGIVLLSPPQVYIERVSNGQFMGSFLDFVPQMYEGVYLEIGGSGNFAFVGLHLWYLLVLILFSVLTVFLFKRTRAFMNMTWIHLLLIHAAAIAAAVFADTVQLGGWDLVVYLVLFLIGYYIFSSEQLLPLLKRTIWGNLSLGGLALVSYTIWFVMDYPDKGSAEFILFQSLAVISTLNIILSFYYIANNYLSFTNGLLRYTSEASLPFYILHQPVIVMTGFFIKDLNWPIPVKAFFLVFVSFAVISAVYHFVFRRFRLLRVLVGLSGKKNSIPVQPPAKPTLTN